MNQVKAFGKRLLLSSGLTIVFSLFFIQSTPAQSFVQAPAYHFVVASYKSFEAANNFVEVLQQKGIQAYIVFPEPEGNAYRVSIFGSSDRSLVANYKNQMKNRYEGWIYFQDLPSPSSSENYLARPTTPNDGGAKTPHPQQRLLSGLENSQGLMYYLILGSYDSYETAQRRVNALRTNKYEPDILLPTASNPKYRVYVYATGNKAEIEAYAQHLEKTKRQKGWIYTQPVELMPFENGLPEPSYTSRGQGNPYPALEGNTSPQPVSAPPSNYFLIAASFRKLPQAQKFAQELVREGFSPLILASEENNGNYRVSVYHAPTREEVEYYNNQLRRIQGKKYWIYHP